MFKKLLGRFEKLGLGFVRGAAGEERGRRRKMKGSRILYLIYKCMDRVGSDPVHFPCIVGRQILVLGYPDQSNVPEASRLIQICRWRGFGLRDRGLWVFLRFSWTNC